MIRLAKKDDAEQLYLLNKDFNGKNAVTLDIVKERLAGSSEIVVVAEENDTLIGFVCVHIMKSFCYSKVYAEITEVFVTKKYRRRRYATFMLEYAQNFCRQNYNVEDFQLFTGRHNSKAKKLYKKLKYRKDKAVLFRKKA